MNQLSTFKRRIGALVLASFIATPMIANAQFPGQQPAPKLYAWSDSSLSPDARADLVIKELTLDEKISLLHGQGGFRPKRRPDGVQWRSRLVECDSALGHSCHSDGGLGLRRHTRRGLGALFHRAAQQPGGSLGMGPAGRL